MKVITRFGIVAILALTGFTAKATTTHTASQDSTATDATHTQAADSIRQVQLGEVEVKAETVKSHGNRDAYVVTKDMKQGLRDAGELLSRIQDLNYNPMTKEVTYLGSKNIVILMDSVEKDADYIKRLSPGRFDRIDVIHNPTGKYTGYDALINFHTRPTYQGYESNSIAQVMMYPKNRHLNDGGMGSLHGNTGITYTREKWNIMFDAGGSKSNIYTSEYYTKFYPLNDRTETTLLRDNDDPGRSNSQDFFRTNLAIDYQIDDNHSLSALWRCSTRDYSIISNQTLAIDDRPAGIIDTIDYSSHTRQDNFLANIFGLYYRGRFGAWNLNTSATYNINDWDVLTDVSRSDGYRSADYRNHSYGYFWGGFDLYRTFDNNRWQFSLSDYITAVNKKEALSGSGTTVSDNSSIQNNLLASVMFSPTRSFSAVVNAGAFYYRNKSLETRTNDWAPRVDVNLFWRPSQAFTARFNYSLQSSMPGLMAISSYGQFTDSLEYQSGNPALKATDSHRVSLNLTLLQCLTLSAYYTNIDNYIANIASAGFLPLADGGTMPYVFNRYENGDLDRWQFGIRYRKRLWKCLDVSAQANLHGCIARYGQYRQEKWTPSADLIVSYRNASLGLAAHFSYVIFNTLSVTPQSKTWGTEDGFSLAVEKNFWKDRLNLMFMWFPPLQLLDGDKNGVTRSPAMELTTWSNDTYRRNNMLSVAISLRFNGGEKVRTYRRNTSELQ